MTDEELLESLDRHFLAGCPELTTSQLGEHRATGSCSECRGRAGLLRPAGAARPEAGILRGGLPASSVPPPPPVPTGAVERSDPEEPWWCGCPDRKGPHVHMPNWSADSRYGVCLTALVDTGTGQEVPGSRKSGGG